MTVCQEFKATRTHSPLRTVSPSSFKFAFIDFKKSKSFWQFLPIIGR